MNKRNRVNKKLFISLFISISISFYFLFYGIFGQKGIIEYFNLKESLTKNLSIKEELQSEIDEKKSLIKRMGVDSIDLDLLDEQARKNLGYANKDEIIIYKNPSEE